ncbi:N-acetylglucosamine-1-phosphotransferase subunits alpha/beta [Frankliniella fusca]|uniref:N-acetylglucosamine-1-phosphotransferase subunits alpha/beta n=1 Tax=Frankliniella fusca TaxID=407009 RepID=A0AAE1GR86_9NEOP|nr:N-acetylglucosamine-1-phosphotransferase subunits alpha/beta [Frankliniella fusca]
MNTWKLLQRKIYDILSHKYLLLVLFPCLLLTLVLLSLIQVGEVWAIWFERSQHGSFTSNPARSCSADIEIDAVYTWVNGSDPILLTNLKHHREENERIERWSECPHPDCEPSNIALYRGCEKFSKHLRDQLPPIQRFEAGPNLVTDLVTSSYCQNETSSLIYFTSIEDASKAILLRKINGSLSQGFWTTDHGIPESYPTPQWIRVSGLVPKFFSMPVESMRKLLSKQMHTDILEIWPSSEHSFVILKLFSPQSVDQLFLKSRVLSLAGDLVVISRVALVFNYPIRNRFDHYAPSRFEDKEELRYSLRSLEKHAPWIRHVYLVTNGQIPHWLDLDNKRITLITHKDIFPNQSHLPTFSSPAIESHLHRIKGLSKKFLYLNDDIMFTRNVWPEDFFTNSKGFKVYLSWPVPDCSPTCLWSWVADGSCDSECNVVECGFDGGDCNGTDSFSNSVKIRMPREEFSVYDEFYDIALGKADNLLNNAADLNFNYLQPPASGIFENNLNSRLKKAALNHAEEDDDLIRLQEPIKEYGEIESMKRHRRAVVKKNLASKSYLESSMVAGQSADFPGSVTNSDSTAKRVLLAADQLRRAERPRHRSPFPQTDLNITNAGKNEKKEGKDSDISNFGLVNMHLNGSNINIYNLTNNLKGINSFSNDNVLSTNRLFSVMNRQKNSPRTSNSTKVKHIHNLMENELNESIDQMLIEKENHRQIWYGKSKHRILDSFAESLLHVNMLYNQVYGFETRRVPAHAPHLIDKHIMQELQEKFPKEWEETSSHKLRSPKDMQFAFSYFYFLMSEERDVTVEELFNLYDTDHSRTWSDREIRTLMTRLYPAPLNPHHLLQFEEFVLACAKETPLTKVSEIHVSTPMYERYQDSPLPTVTWNLVNNCPALKKLMLTNLGKEKKYPYEIVREWSKDVTFKMLHSNVSHLVGHLDDIRRNPKKFVCLNDNLDPKQETENTMVRAVLRDFYHSFFPLPSKFELPLDMRNRFLHVTELEEWKKSRSQLRIAAILAVITLCLLTIAVVCPDEVRHYGRKIIELAFCHQRRRPSRIRSKSRSPVRGSSSTRSV